MSTISLRVAEVEARVHLVRRRINAFTLQHVAYLAGSTVVLIAVLLIVVGLRAPASVFRAAAWVSVAAIALTVAVAAWWTARRWIGLGDAAVLTDRRADLSDRLTTVVSLRSQPPTSRFMPLLVAQALDLRERWRPRSIVPRGIPRSIFIFAASLALLASTAFLERRGIDSAAAKADKGTEAGQRVKAQQPAAQPQRAELRGDTPGEGPEMEAPRFDDDGKLPSTADLGLNAASGGEAPIQGDADIREIPDRLQDAIRRAFRAEPMDAMRDVSAKRDERLSGPNRGGQLNDERRDGAERDSVPGAGKPGERDEPARQPVEQPKLGEDQRKDDQRAGQRRDEQGRAGPRAGASTGAGDGPGEKPPIGDKADLGDAQGEPTTFKLTITSFLAAVDSRGLPQRNAGAAQARTAGKAAGRELSNRQLNDDVLRKTEIPPEYEDVVRRAYSAGK